MVLVPRSCLHLKFTLSTYELRRFLLNVISNKVVAKIYTDLQVFTNINRYLQRFWCLQEAEWLLNQMPGLFLH